jgi:hypothetical protein
MAFDINNFKEAGGPGNSQEGAQLYLVSSDVDNIATMKGSGYLDPISDKLNVRDIVLMAATDSPSIVQVATNVAGVVTVTAIV